MDSSKTQDLKFELKDHSLTKAYEPEAFEKQVYEFWEENDCFSATDENGENQSAFSIVIPPPNVTGALHMGHALTNTIQDILIRWRRMKGDNTLWLPGKDHAGIATQAQVEKAIAKEGNGPTGKPLTRHDLGREKFLERTWKWKEDHGDRITLQLRRLGSSLDWKRERFTLDEGLSKAVREVFVRLHEQGLIYRGNRIINWCYRCHTALSDLEVIPKESSGSLWHIAYPVVDAQGAPTLDSNGKQIELVIATTRPETMLGDSAVAVHPEDERHQHVHGKFIRLPLVDRLIPIITDEYVDREFGSGALKITPAHDFNDYELGNKHQLQSFSVIGKDGCMTEQVSEEFRGLKVKKAREKVVEALEERTLIRKIEPHQHKVGRCQRCDTVAEPILSDQWFIKIAPLAKPAIEAVESGKIQFTPKSWEKTYFEWMYNIRDWCISRQLWWGHQIPAWYCSHCEGVVVARDTPKECSHCKSGPECLKQDEDVLDTWFSSALWPFSTLGWPEKTKELETFYPTSILETGFDILFFWVARMIMMGIHFTGQVPFHKVYLHAMVRDEKGEKMSKSKGNVIDPLQVIDQHGSDPLRFTLAIMAGQGRDVKLSLDRVEGYRAFCNKLWNANKFFLYQLESDTNNLKAPEGGVESWLKNHYSTLSLENQWILSRLQEVVRLVDDSLEKFELNVATQALYDFIWKEFCDWYIELSKLPLRKGGDSQYQTLVTLRYVLDQCLRLLHPFIPFVTEKLWQSLSWGRVKEEGKAPLLMLQGFPSKVTGFVNSQSEESLLGLQNIVEALRNFRGENNISPKKEFIVYYQAREEETKEWFTHFSDQLTSLARVSELKRWETASSNSDQDWSVMTLSHPRVDLRVNLVGLVDVQEELKRLKKEIDKASDQLDFVEKKLSRESFVSKAPQELVDREKKRKDALKIEIEELQKSVEKLQARA